LIGKAGVAQNSIPQYSSALIDDGLIERKQLEATISGLFHQKGPSGSSQHETALRILMPSNQVKKRPRQDAKRGREEEETTTTVACTEDGTVHKY
jgi:hypothetical protein